tara:strand:- start:1058 stop:1321 length:264 start_codon:yes stop_codon:yes gene_type:complete
MNIPSAPEFQKKFNISLAMIVTIASVAFSLGVISVSIFGLNARITDELGGLRSDMNREVEALQLEDIRIEDKITRKINNHKDEKNPH